MPRARAQSSIAVRHVVGDLQPIDGAGAPERNGRSRTKDQIPVHDERRARIELDLG
jgi:hypothetical protein